MRLRLLLPAALALGLAGCNEPLTISPTTQRIGGGTAVGALTGLAIGSISGQAGAGALIGAGVGALGGFAWDQHQRSRERSYEQGYAAGRSGGSSTGPNR